jgi:hypothetical protein
MATCESTSFLYPLLADIYYPIIQQSGYGNVEKTWVLDKTIACKLNPAGNSSKEEIKPNVNITQDSILVGMSKTDLRVSSVQNNNAMTNVIITNIRTSSDNHVYLETAGPRVGKSTIFELATIEPFVGPFGSVEHYSLVIRRSENQAVDV